LNEENLNINRQLTGTTGTTRTERHYKSWT